MARARPEHDTKELMGQRNERALGAALREYTAYLQNPNRIIGMNLLAGVARGAGMVLGATVVITLLVLLLGRLGQVPWAGEYFRWVAEQIRQVPIVEELRS